MGKEPLQGKFLIKLEDEGTPSGVSEAFQLPSSIPIELNRDLSMNYFLKYENMQCKHGQKILFIITC